MTANLYRYELTYQTPTGDTDTLLITIYSPRSRAPRVDPVVEQMVSACFRERAPTLGYEVLSIARLEDGKIEVEAPPDSSAPQHPGTQDRPSGTKVSRVRKMLRVIKGGLLAVTFLVPPLHAEHSEAEQRKFSNSKPAPRG